MAQDIGNSNLLEVWASSGQAVEPDISKIEEGWQLGEQPPHEFMNWLQNTFGEKLNHVLSNGTPQWNSATSYGAGSTVQRGDSVWIAMLPNANSEPSSGNTNWSRLLKLADATAEAAPETLVQRDANGTAEFGEPSLPAHPALAGSVTSVQEVDGDATAVLPPFYGTSFIVVEAATATITIPEGVPVGGRVHVRKIHATQGAVTIARSGTDTITRAGLESVKLNANGDHWLLQKVSSTRWELVEGVESGSNANGTYRRVANGTQVCERVVTDRSVECTTAVGNLFRNGSGENILMAADYRELDPNVPARVSGSVLTEDLVFFSSGRSAESARWNALWFSGSSATRSINFTLYATGRWYA